MLTRALLTLLLTLTACATSTPATLRSPVEAKTPREGHREETRHARLRMTVTGVDELAFTVDTETLIRLVEIYQGKNPTTIYFLSVSAAENLMLPDGRTVLYSADLAPGLYRGPGSYELSDKGGTTIAGVESLGSGAYVQVARGEPDAVFGRFDQFDQPCSLSVTTEARTGTVRCPALLDADRRMVSLVWSWELL